MSIADEAFFDLELSLSLRLNKSWKKIWKKLYSDVSKALEDSNYTEAHRLTEELSLDKVYEDSSKYIRNVGISAIFLGVSRVSDVGSSYTKKNIPEFQLGNAVTQLKNTITENGVIALQKQIHVYIDKIAEVNKSDKYPIYKLELPSVLNTSVSKYGEAYNNLISSLHISRMNSLGFLSEADAVGQKYYVINEILDGVTCPVCRTMHGKRFPVPAGLNQINTILGTNDPNQLKLLSPWPSQTPSSITSLKGMSVDDYISGGLNLPPYHPSCYSEDVSVYTDRGFIPFKDVDIAKDKFLTLDPKTKKPEWTHAVAKQDYPYEGEMVQYYLDNKSVGLTVTPDHSQYVERRVDKGKLGRVFEGRFEKGEKAFKSVENWLAVSSLHEGTHQDFFDIAERLYPSTPFLKFLGYYLSEGHSTKRPYGTECAITQYKYMEDMSMAVQECSIPYYLTKDKIYITDQKLNKWLSKFGKSYEKYIPDFIFDLTPDQIMIFIDAFVLGDGTTKVRDCYGYKSTTKSIYTSSIKLRDGFIELAIKANKSASFRLCSPKGTVTEHHNGTYTSNHDVWDIGILNSIRRHPKTKKVPYSGRVYDVTLAKHHVLLVAEKGRVCWSGNCRGFASVTGQVPDLTDLAVGLGGGLFSDGVASGGVFGDSFFEDLNPSSDVIAARLFGEFDDTLFLPLYDAEEDE